MKFGLSTETIEKIKLTIRSFPEIQTVLLYGSRAKGNFKNGSDIDLALKGPNLSVDTLSELTDKIDELYLPYTFDICIYDQIKNSDLKEHIDRVGLEFV